MKRLNVVIIAITFEGLVMYGKNNNIKYFLRTAGQRAKRK